MSPVLDQVESNVDKLSDTVTSKFGSLGKAMTIAGAATTAMGVSSLKSFGQFQQSLNTAAVVAGGTSKDIQGLSDVANKMGAELPISAQEAANAMTEMARNGASVSQIKEQFPAIAQAATAAGSDLTATAGVVQQAMNIWGNSLKSPQQAASILVQTANMSNASIEDMQQAMATFSGTAKLAGMSMQDTTEAIGLLTNKGFSAAQASQDLNHAVLQMIAPSKTAKNTMNDLGISFTNAQGKMKSFPQILQELNKALSGLSDAERTQALKSMFGTSGMAAIAPLLDAMKNKTDDSAKSWDAWSEKVQKASGTSEAATKTLQDQADEMQKNVGAKIEQVGGNWESLRNKAMASKGGVNGALLDMINKTLEWSTTSNSAFASAIRNFLGLAPAIGPAVIAMGSFLNGGLRIVQVLAQLGRFILLPMRLMISIAKIPAVLSVLGKAFVMLLTVGSRVFDLFVKLGSVFTAGPFGLIIVAIAAVTAALVYFFTQTKTGQALWQNFVTWLSNIWQSLVSIAQAVWNTISNVIKNTISSLVQGLTPIWQGLVDVFNSLAPLILPIIVGLVTVIGAVFITGINLFITIWNMLVPVIQVVWQLIVAIVTSALSALTALITTGVQIIVTVWTTVWNVLVTIVSTVWNIITTVISAGLEVISDVFTAITDVLTGNWSGAWNAIKDIVTTVLSAIISVVSSVLNGIASIFKTVMSGLWSIVKSIWNGIKGTFTAGVNFIRSAVNIDLNAAGRAIMNSLWNGMKSIWNGIKNWVSGIADWIKEHKGPISYDRRLLIPAGQAIMGGLNNGLIEGFKAVQSNVSSMADAIGSSMSVTLPPIQDNSFNRSLNAIQGRMQNMSANVTGTLTAKNVNNNTADNLWRSQMTELVTNAVNKLDNVDQHPEISFNTADKLNAYGNRVNARNLRSYGG